MNSESCGGGEGKALKQLSGRPKMSLPRRLGDSSTILILRGIYRSLSLVGLAGGRAEQEPAFLMSQWGTWCAEVLLSVQPSISRSG